MPINCKIIYNENSSATACTGNISSLTVELVQDAIVKINGNYVDTIDVVYSQDSGNYPTSSFNLVFANTAYEIAPIEVEQVTPTSPSTARFSHVVSEFGAYHVVTFTPPSGTNNIFTLFNFGTDSGPASKLSVRVKREPTFSCP